jgi:hypothetical protein
VTDQRASQHRLAALRVGLALLGLGFVTIPIVSQSTAARPNNRMDPAALI